MSSKAPSQPTTNSVLPTQSIDLPTSIVLLCIYFSCAVCNLIRFRQSHMKFRLHVMLFGFSMSRVVTFAVRAAWSTHPKSKSIAIAATVFVSAGVVIIVIVNMQLLIRLIKSLRPELHLSKVFQKATLTLQLFIIPLLIMTIVPAIQNILSSNLTIKARDQIVLKISTTYIAVYTCLPAVVAPMICFALPKSPRSIVKHASWRGALIVYVATLLGLEMTLRCANTYDGSKLANWYGTRTGFYIFTPMLELMILGVLLVVDLPHMFGNSNDAVLRAVCASSSLKEEASETNASKERQPTIEDVLRQTTTHFKDDYWIKSTELSTRTL